MNQTQEHQGGELFDQALALEEMHTREADSADAELEAVLVLLRREECAHILADRPRHREYVVELIAKFERWEHRR